MQFRKLFRLILGLPYQYPAEKAPKTISVLIPAYNEEKTIADTILSLRNQTRLPDEIIVVDDCSQDRTGEIAKNLGAKVIRLQKNSGTKSQAQNAGLPYIKNDITITIDADTILDSRAIGNIVKPLTDDNTASVCGLVIPQKIETIWERSRFIEYLFGISIMKGAQANLGAILVSSGCFSAFRTKELQKKRFLARTCVEDMDLTWIFLTEKRRIAYQGNAICYPLDPPNWKIYQQQVDRWFRGFFQNIGVHKKDIFKSKGLTLFAGWYLADGLIGTAMMFFLAFALFNRSWILSPIIASNWILIAIASIWNAHRVEKKLLAFTSLPCYFIISFLNIFLFWRACFQEWILRNRLSVWKKGH